MIDVLMLFYTQAELEYSATCCEMHLSREPPLADESFEGYLSALIRAKSLKPDNINVHISGDQRAELRTTYQSLTPFAEHLFAQPFKLSAPFIAMP